MSEPRTKIDNGVLTVTNADLVRLRTACKQMQVTMADPQNARTYGELEERLERVLAYRTSNELPCD